MLVSRGGGPASRSLPELAREAAQAGVDVVQVREKELSDRRLRELVGAVVLAVAGTATRVLVNGRPDVAFVAGAHGVQLPEDGLPVAEVKRAFPALVVGASRHSVEGVRRAQREGADHVVLGPIFASPGKENRALGLAPLREACAIARIPVYAIGGIDAATAPRAVGAGAAGLAAIRAFTGGTPLETVVAELRRARA
jgi:thiamine-phosphate pyrophosphorylase